MHKQLLKLNVKLKLTEGESARHKSTNENLKEELQRKTMEINFKEDSENSFRNQVRIDLYPCDTTGICH